MTPYVGVIGLLCRPQAAKSAAVTIVSFVHHSFLDAALFFCKMALIYIEEESEAPTEAILRWVCFPLQLTFPCRKSANLLQIKLASSIAQLCVTTHKNNTGSVLPKTSEDPTDVGSALLENSKWCDRDM